MDLFTLGELYLSDFLAPDEEPRCAPVEMKMQMDLNTGLVRLEKPADPDFMYGRYWYRSGINQTMTNELHGIVDSILAVKKDPKVWLDIACNDGTLLSFVPDNVWKVGIDPVDDSFTAESRKHANVIVQDYFSANAFHQGQPAGEVKFADVVTCIAMFYDLDDPQPFLKDVKHVMANDGVFVLQMSYTPLMLEQVAFDNICHEHIYYYSLETIREVLGKAGFQIMDCQLNDINGGSFRIYCMKAGADTTKFGSQPHRDVCKFRVDSLLQYEKAKGFNTIGAWLKFQTAMDELKRTTVEFIQQAKREGKTVWAYGASTKGNTLLQYFGLDNTMIDGIAERSPYKFGLRTIGTDIPIYSEEEMRKVKPDYMLVLPWHFINEFVEREHDYLAAGGHFIVPCPKFKVIGAQ